MPTKLYHYKGNCENMGRLLYQLSIQLDVLAHFNYMGDIIKLTKYQVKKISGENPFIRVNSKTKFWCEHCSVDVGLKNVGFHCDECRNCKPISEINPLGLTLILCEECFKKSPKYNDFLGFLPKFSKNEIDKYMEKILQTPETPENINYGPEGIPVINFQPRRLRLNINNVNNDLPDIDPDEFEIERERMEERQRVLGRE